MGGLVGHRGLMLAAAASGAGPVDPYWSKVVSLAHLDSQINGGSRDEVASSPWTLNSGQIVTTKSKWGGASLYLSPDGNGGASRTLGTADALGSKDFTFDIWFFCDASSSGYRNLINSRNADGNSGLAVRITDGGVLQCFWGAGSYNIVGTTAVSLNAWHFVRLIRSGSTWKLYLDGALQGQASLGTATLSYTNQTVIWLGVYGGFSTTTERFVGYLDDFRCTVGQARVGTEVPTAAFWNP